MVNSSKWWLKLNSCTPWIILRLKTFTMRMILCSQDSFLTRTQKWKKNSRMVYQENFKNSSVLYFSPTVRALLEVSLRMRMKLVFKMMRMNIERSISEQNGTFMFVKRWINWRFLQVSLKKLLIIMEELMETMHKLQRELSLCMTSLITTMTEQELEIGSFKNLLKGLLSKKLAKSLINLSWMKDLIAWGTQTLPSH